MRNSGPWDLSFISKKIRVRKNLLLLASASRFQLHLKQNQRKNHEMKIQDPPWGEFPSYISLTPKMNLSLYSPQASLESHVKGSSHCKKLLNQGNLCQNFDLTYEEFNRVTQKTSAEPYPSRLPVAPPFLPVHSPVRASSQELHSADSPVDPCQTRQHSASNIEELSTCEHNVQTTKFFSFLTPAMMMRLSLIVKRTVQQAVVVSHVAAESYHERVQCSQWDVWLCYYKLMYQAVPFRVIEYACPRCCFKMLLQVVLSIKNEDGKPRQLRQPEQNQVPSNGANMPLNMNLSLYSPHAGSGRHVKGSSYCKKLPYQGKLCQNFVLTFEEFN